MKNKKVKKEVTEWIIIFSVMGIIYFGGWHTEIIGRIQQVVLASGVILPTYVDEDKTISYDFSIEHLNGEKVSFETFRNQVLFVNFWATWCPPCIAEMPDIQSLYNSEKSRASFIMISLDDDEEKAMDFIKRKGFDFPVYFLRSALPESYDTHAIPTTYIVDKNGLIKVENHGMAKYNTRRIKELIGALDKLE